ncbi:hypothetical protein HOY82DRAFT_542426 [Tuber indicum]|nr:hypothetical protein HOY82DRAFT_542426 [Tuber indicum]
MAHIPIWEPNLHPRQSIASDSRGFTRRLDHLVQSGAFADCTFSRSPRHGIKRMLERWEMARSTLETTVSKIRYTELKELRKRKTNLVYDIEQLHEFKTIASNRSGQHHCLVDSNGVVLAYRFRYPDRFLTTLETSQHLLPNPHIDQSVRGLFSKRHYALWADYSPDIFYSREYRNDRPYSQDWLKTNKPLFDYLSHDLRMLDTEMYLKFTSIDRFLPSGLARLAGAWHGVAVNQYMVPGKDIASTHVDWMDYPGGFNAVLPWGTYVGGNLVLWPMRIAYELKPGDCLFFRGGIIAHQVQEVARGVRNSLDLFCHKSAFDWRKRKQIAAGIHF